MKKLTLVILALSTSLIADPLKIVTSTTDLAWAVKQIGGAHVEVTSLLKGTENPHYVDAVPEFVRLVADANGVVIVGLDLEVGWMPKVLTRSGNSKVQPGGVGYVEAGKGVHTLERPIGGVDRSMGDIHPAGNPHFWLGPKAFSQAMGPVTQMLKVLDPTHAADYDGGLNRFIAFMDKTQKDNAKQLHQALISVKQPVLVEYHKEFAYFLEDYELKSLGSIEEKPGVAPSAGRLAEMGLLAKNNGVRFALASETAPKKTLERFTEISQIPVVIVPMSLQPAKGLKDYTAFQTRLVDAVLSALQQKVGSL